MTNCWSNEKTLDFIEEVRSHPELWDVEIPMYKVKRLKNDRWRKIGAKFQCSSIEAYKKYRCLRTYAKYEEKKKKRFGIPVKWFAYDALSFLLDQNTNANPRVKREYTFDATDTQDYVINDDKEETVEIDVSDPLLSPVPSQKPQVPRKKYKIVEDIQEVPGKAQNVLGAGENKRNEYSGFAEHIANKLSKYDAYTRAQAEFKIMKVLYECDMAIHNSTEMHNPDNDNNQT